MIQILICTIDELLLRNLKHMHVEHGLMPYAALTINNQPSGSLKERDGISAMILIYKILPFAHKIIVVQMNIF